MENLKYKGTYDHETSKVMAMLEFLSDCMKTSFPEIFKRIASQVNVIFDPDKYSLKLAVLFTKILMTSFVANL